MFLPLERSAFFTVTVVLCLACIADAQSGRVQQTPTPTPTDETLRIHTEEIKLNVLAFDENGNFFRDVNDSDLVITENNILHQPASVRRLPANVLIVMDLGGELRTVKSLDQTRKVARGVVDGLRPGDSVAIMQYSDKAEIVGEWTSDKAQMIAAIKRTNFGRRDMFIEALKLATDFMLKDPLENKHIVLITDGTDSLGRSSAKFDAFQRLFTTNMREAAKMPRVGPTINMDRTLIKKMKARQAELEVSQDQLEKLAENTNGEFILPVTVDEMTEKSALVARMIDSSYVVTYTPKIPVVETRGIAERNIEVTSKRPGLVVQARRKLVITSGKK